MRTATPGALCCPSLSFSHYSLFTSDLSLHKNTPLSQHQCLRIQRFLVFSFLFRTRFWNIEMVHDRQSMARWTVFVILSWCWPSVSAVNDTVPVEVDAVFPLNNTYAPVDLMPVVFAVQNPSAAWPLPFQVQWSLEIFQVDAPPVSQGYGIIDLLSTNYSDSDPYYVFGYANLKNTEGVYFMVWAVYADRCQENSSYADIQQNVTFTVKSGGTEAELQASTRPGTCATIQSTTFGFAYQCPWSGGEANPCELNLNEGQASSISAEITASACAGDFPVKTAGCPQATKAGSAANPFNARGVVRAGGLIFFVVLFSLFRIL
ncbi:hypothetical protein F5Y01DRAFT_278855 [Xylaria sp. FL0043]|nr:hypothetical protein F5Y01DRAFT_278855 [Xylaria sp. FL0043]